MRRSLSLTTVLALAFTVTAVNTARPNRGDSTGDDLEAVLRRAADWVQRFADDSAFVVAEERYGQQYRTKEGTSWKVEHRELVSEIVTVRTPEEELRAGYPWVQFRDVLEVDGKRLLDHRGRLESLFNDANASSYARATALINESARFNIGPGIRTVNVPCFALFFLHARNQRRFQFRLRPYPPQPPHPPQPPVEITYRERERPTMIRSDQHRDLPSSGVVWIEPSTGRVVKTRLEVEVSRHWVMTTEVTYGHDAGIDAWVPQVMREHLGDRSPGGESLDCTATYSNYRRFRTSGRMVVK